MSTVTLQPYATPVYQLVPNFTSIVMDQLDGMHIDNVLCYDPGTVQFKFLVRMVQKYYAERGINGKSFLVKNCGSSYKIWRWK